MSLRSGISRPQSLAVRGTTLAAATAVAGAGMFGVAAIAPPLPGAPLLGHHHVALVDFPTFAESLQTLLNDLGMGDLNDVLAAIDPSLSSTSTFTAVMNTLFPDQPTLAEMSAAFGFPIGIPLYASSGDSLLGGFAGESATSPFIFNEPASFFSLPPGPVGTELLGYGAGDVNGTHLGDLGLGRLVDLLLGGANEGDAHSLLNLMDQLNIDLSDKVPESMLAGMGWLLPLVGLSSDPSYQQLIDFAGSKLDNMNQVEMGVGPLGGHTGHFALPLDANSSINDWLSALLGVPTDPVRLWTVPVFSAVLTNPSTWSVTGSPTLSLEGTPATTLGGYLQGVLFGDSGSTTLADQSLADLFGVNPNETWIQYLAEQAFGGTFFHPSGDTLGDQAISTVLGMFLPDDSTLTIGPDTTITELLEAFGLLSP